MRTRTLIAALTALAAATVPACGGDNSSGDAAEAPPVELEGKVTNKGTEDATGKATVELELDDSYFEPTFIEAESASTLAVEIENAGSANHTFTIDDLGVDEELSPGSKADVEVDVPAGGVVNFYCRFHRASGMQGAVFTRGAAQTSRPPGTSAPAGGGGPAY